MKRQSAAPSILVDVDIDIGTPGYSRKRCELLGAANPERPGSLFGRHGHDLIIR